LNENNKKNISFLKSSSSLITSITPTQPVIIPTIQTKTQNIIHVNKLTKLYRTSIVKRLDTFKKMNNYYYYYF